MSLLLKQHFLIVGTLLVLLAQFSTLCLASERVSVDLFHTQPALKTIYIPAPFAINKPVKRQFTQGQYILTVSQNKLLLKSNNAAQKNLPPIISESFFELQPIGQHPLSLQAGLEKPARQYNGLLQIHARHSALQIQNSLKSSDYVASVISSETPANWPQEALKAQAVLTQTRLLQAERQHHNLVDSTQDERFAGIGIIRPEARQAEQAVRGQVITKASGGNFTPYYHATCGGNLSGESYFKGQSSSIKNGQSNSIQCHHCKLSPFWKAHTVTIPKTQYQKAMGHLQPKILKTDNANRPLLIGDELGHQITGYQYWLKLGQKLGWDKAPGTRFAFERQPNGDIQINSVGAGHGVGLCQWGAAQLAKEGKSYSQILQFYFPSSIIKKH